jgi:O-antigen/teichoic acid export membrane protein
MQGRTKSLIKESLRAILLIILPTVLVISATGRELVELVYSVKYLPSYPSLSILVFGVMSFTIFTAQSYILSGAGKPQVSSLFGFTGLITTIIFCYLLIPRSGMSGAAIAMTIGSTLSMALTSLYVYRKFKVLIPIRSALRIGCASGLIYFLALTFKLPILLLPLTYIILFAVYFLILIALKEISSDDYTRFQKILPNRIPIPFKK